jgi:hypothetical protein
MKAKQFRNTLEMEAEQALFEGRIEALVAACCENERPLQGLAGQMDWRFLGVISRYLREGAVTGREGECVYVPVSRPGKMFRILLAGAGRNEFAGNRGALPKGSIDALARNVSLLRLTSIGVSPKDVGQAAFEELERRLEGVALWPVH